MSVSAALACVALLAGGVPAVRAYTNPTRWRADHAEIRRLEALLDIERPAAGQGLAEDWRTPLPPPIPKDLAGLPAREPARALNTGPSRPGGNPYIAGHPLSPYLWGLYQAGIIERNALREYYTTHNALAATMPSPFETEALS